MTADWNSHYPRTCIGGRRVSALANRLVVRKFTRGRRTGQASSRQIGGTLRSLTIAIYWRRQLQRLTVTLVQTTKTQKKNKMFLSLSDQQ